MVSEVMEQVTDDGTHTDERWEQAVAWFLRVRSEAARVEDLPELRRWIESDSRNALAYQQVAATWDTVGQYASAAPIVAARRDALQDSQVRTHAHPFRRWALAACAAFMCIASGWWLLTAPRSTVYTTDVGEQRTLHLPDGSVIALDAQSTARVRYTDQERLVTLERGQARFNVARDALRPFRVQARGQTVTALGTQFDVELVSHTVLVTLIEGHVAVAGVPANSSAEAAKEPATSPTDATLAMNHDKRFAALAHLENRPGERIVELTPGQALHVHDDGHADFLAHVDLAHATGWQTGKMFFDNEPLVNVVERMDRYTRRQVHVDPSIADINVSGIFSAGDTAAFIDAVAAYFPIEVVRSNDSIYLTRRR
jgi:transmembrane sensor